jgi:hypothetical protein
MKVELYYKLSFKFNYRVLSRRERIKTICESETLVDQERHLALEMSTSRTVQLKGRERSHLQNNNKAKPKQVKLSKTDLSTWP